MRREFLTVYDYGQGGVWTLLLANSTEQIRDRYPELKVVTRPPDTMTEEELERIRSKRHRVDIDDLQEPFLKSLREHRPGT
jgi:hypothetical protein